MAVPERPKKRKRPPDENDEDEEGKKEPQDEDEEENDDVMADTSDAEEHQVSNASRPSSQHASEPELDSCYDLVDDFYPTFFRLPRAYEGNNDDLMPEDTDEEALKRVLGEEEELDAQDLVAEGEYEDDLWTTLTGDPS